MSLAAFALSVHRHDRMANDAVDRMVRECHYLRRWPGTVMAVMRLDSFERPVGVMTYSLPPRQTLVRYRVANAWELSRLWVSDDMPRNTESWFIAKSIAWIKRNRPTVELLVSYADPTRRPCLPPVDVGSLKGSRLGSGIASCRGGTARSPQPAKPPQPASP